MIIRKIKKENKKLKRSFRLYKKAQSNKLISVTRTQVDNEWTHTVGVIAKAGFFKDKKGNILDRIDLYNTLRLEGYLMEEENGCNTPYQKYMDMGYFVVNYTIYRNDLFVATVKITERGKNKILTELQNKGYNICKSDIIDSFQVTNEAK